MFVLMHLKNCNHPELYRIILNAQLVFLSCSGVSDIFLPEYFVLI